MAPTPFGSRKAEGRGVRMSSTHHPPINFDLVNGCSPCGGGGAIIRPAGQVMYGACTVHAPHSYARLPAWSSLGRLGMAAHSPVSGWPCAYVRVNAHAREAKRENGGRARVRRRRRTPPFAPRWGGRIEQLVEVLGGLLSPRGLPCIASTRLAATLLPLPAGFLDSAPSTGYFVQYLAVPASAAEQQSNRAVEQ